MILLGDCLEQMKTLHAKSINTCVTSPPYWGLRDYGVDGQLGLEKTPDEFVANLVNVFREVKRVLKDDGTLWLNLGDTYASTGGCGHQGKHGERATRAHTQRNVIGNSVKSSGLKAKDLIGIPWRVAFALQADGWYLRQDIIWHKPNPMPESVTDRCTKAHEYIFLLSKSAKYYFDNESILEPFIETRIGKTGARAATPLTKMKNDQTNSGGFTRSRDGKNKRSVWTVTTKPFKGAHFATFPPDLIEPCILAGCPKDGVVLDPFFGAGTTGLVAKRLGRNYIGCELSAEYVEIAEKRIAHAKETTQEETT